MTQATSIPRGAEAVPQPRTPRDIQSLWRSMEIDSRLLGMIAALAIIWLSFHILSGGLFLTVGPERIYRDHGHRHGPDHRLAQH